MKKVSGFDILSFTYKVKTSTGKRWITRRESFMHHGDFWNAYENVIYLCEQFPEEYKGISKAETIFVWEKGITAGQEQAA